MTAGRLYTLGVNDQFLKSSANETDKLLSDQKMHHAASVIQASGTKM